MAKRPHLKAPAPVQEILAKILKPQDLRQLELCTQLRQVWEECMSASVRENTQLIDFKSKTLLIAAANHAWLQDLQFRKPEILAALQRQLGQQRLKDIKFLLQSEHTLDQAIPEK